MLRWKKLEKREIGIRSQPNFPFEATKSRSGSDCSSWFSCLPCPNQGSSSDCSSWFSCLPCPNQGPVRTALSWFSCLPCPNQGPVRTALPDFPACPVRIKVQFGLLFLVFLLALSESRSGSDCFSWFSCLPCPNQGSSSDCPFLIFHYPCLNQRSVFILNGLF